jgi:hypothetical protein
MKQNRNWCSIHLGVNPNFWLWYSRAGRLQSQQQPWPRKLLVSAWCACTSCLHPHGQSICNMFPCLFVAHWKLQKTASKLCTCGIDMLLMHAFPTWIQVPKLFTQANKHTIHQQDLESGHYCVAQMHFRCLGNWSLQRIPEQTLLHTSCVHNKQFSPKSLCMLSIMTTRQW